MRQLFLISIFILLVNIASGQSAEQKVSETVERLRLAMINPDKASLEKLTVEGLSYGHSSGKVEDRAAFIEALVSGKSDFVDIQLTDQTITVVDKTAIVRHKLSGNVNDGGKASTVNIAVLLVFVNQGKEWRLTARQAVKI